MANLLPVGIDSTSGQKKVYGSGDTLEGGGSRTKSLSVQIFNTGESVTTGSGKASIGIPLELNGWNITRCQAIAISSGSTNATTINVYNNGFLVTSTAISIASGANVGTPGTLNSSNVDLTTNQILRIDVATVSLTPPQGLIIIIEFELP